MATTTLSITFVDEQGTNLNRYIVTNVATGDETIVDLARNGTITQQGTPLTASILNQIVSAINEHVQATNNPHSVTKAQVGLGNVDNTSDANKPVSTAQQNALDLKQDKSNLVVVIDDANPSDTKYPSEKAVVDYVENITNEESIDVSDNNLYKISGQSDSLALPRLSQVELKEKLGNTFVYNQQVTSPSTELVHTIGSQYSENAYRCDKMFKDHYYLKIGTAKSTISGNYLFVATDNVWETLQVGVALTSSYQTFYSIYMPNYNFANSSIISFRAIDPTGEQAGAELSTKNVYNIDLTQWFGSNYNIPSDILTTPSNFFKYYRGDLSFNVGQIRNANANKIKSIGRNIWDEDMERGDISTSTGINVANATCVRSKNYIEIKPNTTYYFKTSNSGIHLYYYDINKNFISHSLLNANTTFITLANATYLRFVPYTDYGTTYKHDICINVSDPNFNGRYEPYVVLSDENTGSEVLRSAGSVADSKTPDGTITRRIGSYTFTGSETWTNYGSNGAVQTNILSPKAVSLGSNVKPNISSDTGLTPINRDAVYGGSTGICTNDVYVYVNSSSVSSLTGKTIYYELAKPTTEQGTPFDNHINVANLGAEMQLSSDNYSIPFIFNKNYDISIKDQTITNVLVDKEQTERLNELDLEQKNLDSRVDSLENELVEQSVDVTDTKIIKVSGLDDNLAIPEESQVEIPKVVCGTLARNNLLDPDYLYSSGAFFTKSGNSEIFNGTNTGSSTEYNFFTGAISADSTHVYLFAGSGSYQLSLGTSGANRYSNNLTVHTGINSIRFYKQLASGASFNNEKVTPFYVDLTITYGSTIANYLASLSNDNALAWLRANDPNIFKYRDYGNALVNTNGDLITTNRNVWDEKWEKGWINYNNGNNTSANDALRSENYIEVISGGNVRIQSAYTGSGQVPYIYFYDTNKNYIGYDNAASSQNSKTFAIPNNCCFVRFAYPNLSTPVAYNHDICVNVSDTSFNGQYVSHKQETQALPSGYGIPKLVDNKLSFDGDEIIGDKFNSKYDIVDLGTLNWYCNATYGFYAQISDLKNAGASICSKYVTSTIAYDGLSDKELTTNSAGLGGTLIIVKDSAYLDVATFKTAMSGVMLVYEKAQPTQSIITPIHPMSCYKGGYELQSSDVPYTLTRNYDISIKDQVKTNVEVDREQSNIIKEMKDKLDLIDPSQYVTAVDDSIIPNSPNPVQSKVIQATYQQKESGKGLSANDFTNDYKIKLDAQDCYVTLSVNVQYSIDVGIYYESIVITNNSSYKIDKISWNGTKSTSVLFATNISPNETRTVNPSGGLQPPQGLPYATYSITFTIEYTYRELEAPHSWDAQQQVDKYRIKKTTIIEYDVNSIQQTL